MTASADHGDVKVWSLRIDGLVQAPLELTLDDLARLDATATVSQGDGQRLWEGVSLAAVLALARPLPAATALYAHAAGYRALLSLDTIHGCLLATRLNGAPLAADDGGPCRLIVSGSANRFSVKGVHRIELYRRRREGPTPPAPGRR